MLLHISQVIPSDVWITDMQVKRGSIEIKGGTPGYNQVSDFLKALSGSAYFTEVKLQDIREKNSKNKDQRFQTFSIKAQGRLE